MTTTRTNSVSRPGSLPERSPEEIWAGLMAGNKRFQDGNPAPREYVHRRAGLANGQRPRVIVLTCSDSRVSPSLVFDQNLGDLFVIRTAGNVADPVALGSIEYAAEFLDARVLVIMGHEKCGAVAAAVSGETPPSPNLEAIVDKVRPALASVKGRAGGEELLRLAEQANVHQSASDLLRNSPLLQQRVKAGRLTLIKALYQLTTGQVIHLPD
ncbi:MAG: carbonic anhydrase [Acidobacteria bacterium]|nr:carbonic anhydrase [Acidobacteriota bacterium]